MIIEDLSHHTNSIFIQHVQGDQYNFQRLDFLFHLFFSPGKTRQKVKPIRRFYFHSCQNSGGNSRTSEQIVLNIGVHIGMTTIYWEKIIRNHTQEIPMSGEIISNQHFPFPLIYRQCCSNAQLTTQRLFRKVA